MKCIICKQTLTESDLIVETTQGPVHAGFCSQHLNEINQKLNESEGQTEIENTQLL